MANNCNRLVLEVNQGCPRGFAFTLEQTQLNLETGEYETTPLDLTLYEIVMQVKMSPYFSIPALISKTISLNSDEATMGKITNALDGQFTLQVTMEDTLKLPPADYSLILYLVQNGIYTNIGAEGNEYAIFRVCHQ